MNAVPEPKLAQLYQEVILDHNKNPRNFRQINAPDVLYSHGYNPLCGDDYHIFAVAEGDTITDVAFQGNGCAISKASASMMTTMVKGQKIEKIEKLESDVMMLLTQEDVPQAVIAGTGNMIIFQGVKQFPVRVKCATLAWHALKDALKDRKK